MPKPQFSDPFGGEPLSTAGGGGGVDYTPRDVQAAVPAELSEQLMRVPGVTGVGAGVGPLGQDVIQVFVHDRGVLARLPKRVGGRDVVGTVTGPVDALPAARRAPAR